MRHAPRKMLLTRSEGGGVSQAGAAVEEEGGREKEGRNEGGSGKDSVYREGHSRSRTSFVVTMSEALLL